jgi:hypothetical protein
MVSNGDWIQAVAKTETEESANGNVVDGGNEAETVLGPPLSAISPRRGEISRVVVAGTILRQIGVKIPSLPPLLHQARWEVIIIENLTGIIHQHTSCVWEAVPNEWIACERSKPTSALSGNKERSNILES